MAKFKVEMAEAPKPTLMVGFGDESAETPGIGQEAADKIASLVEEGALTGGPLLRIDGPMAVAVAMGVAHDLGHLYGAIAVRDPKLGGRRFVVAISHNPDYPRWTVLEG